MNGKQMSVSILVLFGFCFFLAVSPVYAGDPIESTKANVEATKAAHAVKAKAEMAEKEAAQTMAAEKININKADLETLTHLKGIGHETAQGIITYREKVGYFQKAEDLLKVKGIGEQTLEQIKPFISLD